nr:hypothetical protein [Brucella anthropi]
MISAPSALVALLQNAGTDGLKEHKLIWFSVKERGTGNPIGRGIWDGSEDLNYTVVSGVTGLPEARAYYGASLLSVGDIVCTTDMTVQSVTINLSQIADVAQQLIRQYNARLARVEIHTLYMHPETGMPVGALLDWVGEIDKAPIKTPAIGGEGSIAIKTVSDIMSMLTRVNGRKSSFEDQRKHADGDEWSKYASTAGTWDVNWGQKSK